jgi:hypothetical protein
LIFRRVTIIEEVVLPDVIVPPYTSWDEVTRPSEESEEVSEIEQEALEENDHGSLVDSGDALEGW